MRTRSLLFFLAIILLLNSTSGARRRKHKVIKVEDYEYRDTRNYDDGVFVDSAPTKSKNLNMNDKINRANRLKK
uniref:Uncharacterized protein n=1 Tax=Acrobeloides nanus TaxID=290746 RepID=A0A914DTG6_9BILA